MNKSNQKKRAQRSSDSDSDNDQSPTKKINADDHAWLETLTERQREFELLKRHEERETQKHREEISKKLRSKTDESKSKSDNDDTDNEIKTKANTYDANIYADDDGDDFRSVSNRRQQINASKQKDTQHSKLLEALKAERKKKQDIQLKKSQPKSDDLSSSDEEITEKPSKTNKKEKWSVNDVYASGSDDDDDDNDNRRRKRSRSPDDRAKEAEAEEIKRKKCTPISTKSHLKSMVLSRFRMEKWCHAPFFPSVAKGAFVRINIGQNNGTPIYRVCEIRDVVETGKVYNLGPTRTNKGLRLKHGHNERVFRLEYVSNSEISDTEFKRWRETTLKQGIRLPTLEDVDNKIKAIDKCKNYVLSNKDISKIVEEKSRFRKAPINYAMTKNELLKEIEMAKDDNDTVKENELKRKLNEMEQRASELDQKRSQNISVMVEINRRNRKSTQQNVESALAREALEHRTAAADPFTRRRCAPTLGSKAPPTKEELIRELQTRRAAEEAAAVEKKKAEEQRLLTEKNNALKMISTTAGSTINKQILPDKSLSSMTTHERGSFTSLTENNDELFTSHDFELELNIKVLSD